MEKVLMFAGIGGQGLQLAGKLLIEAALSEGREVSFFPIYGGQKRGGVSSCYVIISDQPIGAPSRNLVDAALLMDPIGYNNYHQHVSAGGILIVNSSMIAETPEQGDYQLRMEPFLDIVQKELGSGRAIGIFALGYVLGLTGLVKRESMAAAIIHKFSDKKIQDMNILALDRGIACAQKRQAQ